ncbi:MAG: SDR family oxidoreductase [Actinomycetaceae bacterium]|nr:SDR family oxidoreductase [Actinomycetaceae bacterium]
MNAPLIGITGVTGQLGGAVARLLEQSVGGDRLRLFARDPSRLPHLPGAERTKIAYEHTRQVVEALRGVHTLFFVSGGESLDRVQQHKGLIDAAIEAGIEHIVYTSFIGAGPDSTFTLGRDHGATEKYIRASGAQWTFLRDNFYLDFFAYLPDEEGVIRGPAADGRVAGVARQDIAEVAAAVLADSATWAGQTLNLTGPEALTLDEIAETLTRIGQRPVTYIPETVEEAYESRKKWEAEPWQYDAWVSTYTAIASGELAEVSPDVERVLGRPATSFEELLIAAEK